MLRSLVGSEMCIRDSTGCLEKEEFVAKAKESLHLRVLPVAGPIPAYVRGEVEEITTHAAYSAGLAKHRDDTGLPVIVDFFSQSCGPCIQIAPIFSQLAAEYAGRAVFWKVDVNVNHQTSSAAGVRSMPTFQFFLYNQKKHEFSGADANGVRQMTEQLISQSQKAGTYIGMEVTEEAIKAFYDKNADQVGAKADPSAIAAKYQGKTALLVKHMKAKYGDAPKPSKKLFRPADKSPKKRRDANEGKCQTPDVQETLQSASSEALEAEIERRRLMDATPASLMFEEADLSATEPEKMVIVGGGPAGLSAAVYAARAGLTPVVVAPQIGGQLLGKGVDVENYPGVVGKDATGRGLVMLMRQQTYKFETRLVDDTVTRIDLTKTPFEITLNSTADSGVMKTHSIVVATGADSRWLGVQGEHEYRGGGVSSCATCDGFLYRDQDVVVIGGGDTAMEDALVLARTSASVTVVHRRDEFRASHALSSRVLSHPKITVRWDSVVEEFQGVEEDGKQGLTHVLIKNTKTGQTEQLAAGAAFVAIGHIPNTGMFKQGLEMDAQGYLVVDPHSTRTSVDGVFAAGDASDKIYRQAITSAGSGAMAALDAERWLSEKGLGADL
eukprot:TRINITY_DN19153_c0_g1_i1.p1 TRINITY_DN19153_c0_g1~~TRINITY_DN19153_c0_g1_i1.p1  ORF type:complete len:611 (+),score=149.38 TRINITY_DN19153_c0_g1_i1:130-1962(+)